LPNLRQSPAADISREFQTGLPPDVRTRPYISVTLLAEDVSESLAVGDSEVITFLPPEGYLYKIIAPGFWTNIPSGATSGKQILSVYSGWGVSFGVECDWMYNEKATLVNHAPYLAESYFPSDLSAFVNVLLNLLGDETWGIKFSYTNNTDVSQSNTRCYRLLVMKERV